MHDETKIRRKRKFANDQNAVIAVMKTGVKQKEAAAIVGINEVTLSNWKAKYPDFNAALKEIKDDLRAKAVQTTVSHMNKIDDDGLPTDAASKTAQWMLENIDNDNFSKKQKIEHEGQFTLSSLIDTAKEDLANVSEIEEEE